MKPGSLFDRIFGFLGQLIALNLLWIVCSLPIITAGASTTALFYCTLKLHKDGDIRVLHDFFKSFKQNFRQSTLIWILMAAAGIFIYMEKEALATMPGSMSQIFNYVIFAVYIPLVAVALYVFPTVAAFENKTMTLITNAFYFAVKHIGYALAVAVITICLLYTSDAADDNAEIRNLDVRLFKKSTCWHSSTGRLCYKIRTGITGLA